MPISLERKGILLVLAAPSGGGKSTVLRSLQQSVEGLAYSVSYTSRSPRPKEREGVDYHFVTVEEFQHMIRDKEFYEWAQVHGNLYGTSRKTVEDLISQGLDVGMDLDVQGARAVKRINPDAVTVFLLPPSMVEIEERLRRRGADREEAIRLRLENAAEEIAQCGEFDYLVMNERLESAIAEVSDILAAERRKSGRLKRVIRDEPDLDEIQDATS